MSNRLPFDDLSDDIFRLANEVKVQSKVNSDGNFVISYSITGAFTCTDADDARFAGTLFSKHAELLNRKGGGNDE
jgi:hypothetical protein